MLRNPCFFLLWSFSFKVSYFLNGLVMMLHKLFKPSFMALPYPQMKFWHLEFKIFMHIRLFRLIRFNVFLHFVHFLKFAHTLWIGYTFHFNSRKSLLHIRSHVLHISWLFNNFSDWLYVKETTSTASEALLKMSVNFLLFGLKPRRILYLLLLLVFLLVLLKYDCLIQVLIFFT